MQIIHCPICGADNPYKVRYPERFHKNTLEFVARKTPDHMHFRILECLGCGMVYSSPVLPETEILQLYREGGYIEEPQLKNMLADYRAQLEGILPLTGKGSLLEVGCSSGMVLEAAKACGFAKVCGIEPNRAAYDHIPADIRTSVVNDELKPGLFPPGSFDVVCFFQVFDHVFEPNRFLRTVRDYLKPGGVLLALHHDIRALMPRLLGARASTYDISHIHLWDKRTMRLILEKNGFRVERIRNISNRYQWDHVVRMLPLPQGLRDGLRSALRTFHLSDWNIRAGVENMVCVAVKA